MQVAVNELLYAGRANAPNVLIVVSDGDGAGNATNVATFAKSKGLLIYSVSVGASGTPPLLKTISSSGQVFLATDYSQLTAILTPLVDAACTGTASGAAVTTRTVDGGSAGTGLVSPHLIRVRAVSAPTRTEAAEIVANGGSPVADPDAAPASTSSAPIIGAVVGVAVAVAAVGFVLVRMARKRRTAAPAPATASGDYVALTEVRS